MSQHTPNDCERIEGLLAAFVEPGGLSMEDGAAVASHLETCTACRGSFAAFARIEEALASRRSEVPPVDAFLPDFAALRAGVRADKATAAAAHSRLVTAFRAMMSVPGIAIILVVWGAMFLLRFRDTVGEVFTWTSFDRLSALTHRISSALVGVSGGDPWTLTTIYVALALLVLGSTGVITMRYIRQS